MILPCLRVRDGIALLSCKGSNDVLNQRYGIKNKQRKKKLTVLTLLWCKDGTSSFFLSSAETEKEIKKKCTMGVHKISDRGWVNFYARIICPQPRLKILPPLLYNP